MPGMFQPQPALPPVSLLLRPRLPGSPSGPETASARLPRCLSSFLNHYMSADLCPLDCYSANSFRLLPLPFVVRVLHHRRLVDALSAVHPHMDLGLGHGGDLLALGGLPGAAKLPVEVRSLARGAILVVWGV